ncbi:hypothetical protein [Rhodococcus sp. BP22]|nr:hypothetical protein [Rhodococcus sp. BP22]
MTGNEERESNAAGPVVAAAFARASSANRERSGRGCLSGFATAQQDD